MHAALALTVLTLTAAPAAPAVEQPYVFTDGRANIGMNGQADGTAVTGEIRTITVNGWGPRAKLSGACADGRVSVAPLAEGIHIVTLSAPVDAELRFLAIDPPARADEAALIRNLPQTGLKLVNGEAYTILAMGDSVTNTGDYETMLAMMLARATGNEHIRVIDKSYPGRSVDAAVRFFEDDAIPSEPDLGLLMYGLNDQVCFVPLDAYLEQYEFIAERLARELNADTVFLQPTPHIDIAMDDEVKGNAPHFALRTIGFAESLRPLAERLGVPLAETFSAIWGRGGDSIRESARRMWPKYPPSYNQQMKSCIETGGKGDTIHPNALGHLAIARSVLDAIVSRTPEEDLRFDAFSWWSDDGVVSRMTLTNTTRTVRRGRVEVHPLLEDELAVNGTTSYALPPGRSITFDVVHRKAAKPEDLLSHPANIYLAPGKPLIPIVDFSGGESHVYAVSAPFGTKATYLRGKVPCVGNTACVQLEAHGALTDQLVTIPSGSDVGRIPLVKRVPRGEDTAWAVAEFAYVRYGSALRGEAKIDGDLSEWENHVWSPLGHECQARWVRGPDDNRKNAEEFHLRTAFKAGARGLYLAASITGGEGRDHFTVFFDTRAPEFLGSAGRYYWVSGKIGEAGRVELARGETSKKDEGLTGRYSATKGPTGLEVFIPYELFELDTWPSSGDLGVSIWWVHTGDDGKQTNLMWSEDGHPWNSRWYCVVRLQEEADRDALPFMARVK